MGLGRFDQKRIDRQSCPINYYDLRWPGDQWSLINLRNGKNVGGGWVGPAQGCPRHVGQSLSEGERGPAAQEQRTGRKKKKAGYHFWSHKRGNLEQASANLVHSRSSEKTNHIERPTQPEKNETKTKCGRSRTNGKVTDAALRRLGTERTRNEGQGQISDHTKIRTSKRKKDGKRDEGYQITNARLARQKKRNAR